MTKAQQKIVEALAIAAANDPFALDALNVIRDLDAARLRAEALADEYQHKLMAVSRAGAHPRPGIGRAGCLQCEWKPEEWIADRQRREADEIKS